MMRPEDHYKATLQKTSLTHSGSGYTVPSVYKQGYDYAAMGYTTVFEAAIPPLEARHTHEEMRTTPLLDMGGYLVLGNSFFMMRYLREGDIQRAAAYVAWMMKTHKTMGSNASTQQDEKTGAGAKTYILWMKPISISRLPQEKS